MDGKARRSPRMSTGPAAPGATPRKLGLGRRRGARSGARRASIALVARDRGCRNGGRVDDRVVGSPPRSRAVAATGVGALGPLGAGHGSSSWVM